MNVVEMLVNLLRLILRVAVGVAMIYSGVELIRGHGLLSHSQFDSVLTAIFVILLGVYCILFGLYNNIYRYLCTLRSRYS